MKELFTKLLMLFNKTDKKKLSILLIMMVLAALFETIGIGLIVPLIGIVTNPEFIQEQAMLSYLYNVFNFQSTIAFTVFTVVIVLGIYICKNLYLLLFHYFQYRVILNQQVKLSRRLFKEYLTKPYAFHLQRNSANLLRNINGEVGKVFQGIILSGFQLFTEVLVITFILILLLVTAPMATLTAAVLLGGSVSIFFKVFRKKIKHLGKEHQKVSGTVIKWIKQGLGASKEVKVSGKEDFFINAYTKQNSIKAKNSRYKKMLDIVPRLYIETLLVSIILITLLVFVFQGATTSELISTMALFAMAAFRLMPSITRVVGMITSIRYSLPALDVVHRDLFMDKDKTEEYSNDQPIHESETVVINKGQRVFNDSIQLSNISFRYPNQKEYALEDVSLTIPIGQSVAFVGESGAGKTTVVDIILGLFQPEKGCVTVDGEDLFEQKLLWQQKIGYIPQSIFLSDDTIRCNVAFGIRHDQIDDDEVWRALEQAQLKEYVESLPGRLDTVVGERGMRLSGGQRQRIGIARALYHNPEILFMDEATSALDNETEKEIMRAIDGLKGEKTLIIIAHRLSTIENCDTIFKMSKGRLININNKIKQSVM